MVLLSSSSSYVSIPRTKLIKLSTGTDFSELCITSDAKIEKSDADEIVVKTIKAEGQKCPVCLKISKDQCERHSV